VVYVTHRLDEVFATADTVTILTDGCRVYSGPVARTSDAEVRRMIVGARAATGPAAGGVVAPAGRASGEPMLELSGISGRRVRDVSLTVRAGEVVAVTGLVGSGRSELGRLVYGLQHAVAGTVRRGGRPVRTITTRAMRRAGVGYSPQNRRESLLTGLDVGENLAVTSYAGLGNPAGLSRARIRRMAVEVVARMSVRPADPAGSVDALSGGNQQKVALGKWIRRPLRLLVLDEPLQGIDVGAKEEIMLAIREQAQSQGLAVLWLESDIEEVVKYADRTVVMRDGRCRAELPAGASRDQLLEAVYGRGAVVAAGGEEAR
jgi:ribose transport system ATP-binding protein